MIATERFVDRAFVTPSEQKTVQLYSVMRQTRLKVSMIIRKPSVNTSYAAEVLRMGDMSTCYKQSIALGSISIPCGPSMLIREFVADMDGSLQFSSWGTMLILYARASMVRCNDR